MEKEPRISFNQEANQITDFIPARSDKQLYILISLRKTFSSVPERNKRLSAMRKFLSESNKTRRTLPNSDRIGRVTIEHVVEATKKMRARYSSMEAETPEIKDYVEERSEYWKAMRNAAIALHRAKRFGKPSINYANPSQSN